MSGYFKVPNDVYDAFAKTDPATIMVYICLARNAAYYDRASPHGYEVRRGECDMTLKQVADAVGITKSSARTRIEKLTQIGSISARRATQRRNVITLNCQALDADQRTDYARTANDQRTDCARTTHGLPHLSNTKTKTKTKTNDSVPTERAQTPGGFIDNSVVVPPPWHVTIADRLQGLCHTEEDAGALCRLANELAAKSLSGQKVGRQRVEDLLTAIERSDWRAHGGVKQLREYLIGGLLREIDGSTKPVETYTPSECQRLAESRASEAFQALMNSGGAEGMGLADVAAWKTNKAAELLPSILREHGH